MSTIPITCTNGTEHFFRCCCGICSETSQMTADSAEYEYEKNERERLHVAIIPTAISTQLAETPAPASVFAPFDKLINALGSLLALLRCHNSPPERVSTPVFPFLSYPDMDALRNPRLRCHSHPKGIALPEFLGHGEIFCISTFSAATTVVVCAS